MSRPSLQYLRLGELVAAVGGDPWAVDDSVQVGSPTQINFLAQAFHSAAGSSTAAEENFRTAQQHFEQYNRENGQQPINNGAEVQRVKEALHATNQQLGQIAADLETIAAALAQARQSCGAQIEALNANLQGYDEYLADYNTHYLGYQLHGDDVDTLIEKCWDGAIADTRTVLSNVSLLRGAYSKTLQAALTNLQVKNGYVPDVLVRSSDASETPPTPLNPADVESFRVLAREVLANDGIPPDQIEARVTAAVMQVQQPLARYGAPEAQRQAPLGFGDAFGDRWRATENAVKNLLGQGGPGAPGVLESWGGLAKGLGDSFLNPVGAGVAQVKGALNAPSPAYFLGEKAFDVSAAAVTLPFGAEGAIVRAGLPAEVVGEGGAPVALLRDWHPTGGLSWQEFEASFGRPETRVWPENSGFPPGYIPRPTQLPEGTIIDRFGSPKGRYFAPDGALFVDRSLPPESFEANYSRYRITGNPLPPGWQIVEGPVEPFYGQTPSPGATQYMIVGPDGITVNAKELVARGILDEYGPPLGR
ncbi:hypothetical protein BST33_18885 [Mycolicibacter minnesotensis]|uniref:DUF4237 domain-containing protein n=2 Tax=Mycobacteriaceae TaxID=1762 RepID=A0AA91M2R1_9MYCO|nr:TNT domain-containing protein [Mycolicibacter minnesotensis]ORA97407.1 hypothetical protein BST33_18885 [Mycolicibacter minnesotensis]